MPEDRIVDLEKALASHPCYNEAAHLNFARMHLPVAPRCNIQCNYCNRKYDCCNESRPGVTSEVLSPQQAIAKVRMVKEKIPELSVVAVAGPGDPLANEETFESLELVVKEYPDITLCLSTNGLALPDHVDRLWDLGIRFVTVTINAIDPEVAKDIYQFVNYDGRNLKGSEAAETLISRQLLGVERCVRKGMLVKINMVLIPGINDRHIPVAVKRLKEMGVYIVNILPLIPVEGTRFENQRAPTAAERRELQDLCANDVRMMRHCKQCRADAIGLLGKDRQDEFAHCGAPCGDDEGPAPIVPRRTLSQLAVASTDGESVDGGFGNSPTFYIYGNQDGKISSLGKVELNLDGPVYGEEHRDRLEATVNELAVNDVIIVNGIGDKAMADLSTRGVKVLISHGSVEEALQEALDNYQA